MELSGIHFDPGLPWWADYRHLLEQVKGDRLTDCTQLNTLLEPGLKSGSGQSIRFVPSTELGDTGYECRIYTTGRVSTRPDSWHDLFNALVWARFPRIKLAINSLHYQAWDKQHDGRRGKIRDALTLFDECGVIVISTSRPLLESLARRHWHNAFLASDFDTSTRVAICGHAMLEKYLAPYKSMTAKALFLKVDEHIMLQPVDWVLKRVDEVVADWLLASTGSLEPADLGPLPVSGIPGWWPFEAQDESFYADPQVFRPPPADLKPAQVLTL